MLKPKLVIAGTLAAFLLIGMGMAARKAPWCDEGWFGSAAYHLSQQGRLVIPEIEPAPDDPKFMHSDEHIFWNVPLYEVWEGVSAKVFGFSLFESRVAGGLVWGLIAIAAWALVVRRVAGGAAALMVLLLLGFDHTFVSKASDVRMDTMSAALGALGILFYLRYRQENLSRAILLSQSFVTLSFLTHPNGGILAFLDTAALALYYDRSQLRPRHVIAAATPYLAGALGWGLYLMQDFALARVQFGGTAAGRVDAWIAPFTALRNEILQRYVYAFGGGPEAGGLGRLKLLLLAGYAIGVAGALAIARRVEPARVFLMLAALHVGYLTFFDGTKQGAYLVHTIPLLEILLAVWITTIWKSSRMRPLLAAGVAVFALLQFAASANTILRNRDEKDYLAAARYLRQNAGREDLVLAPTEMEYELGFERPFSDDQRLGYYSRKQPKFMVINGLYRTWFETFRTREPAIYAHVQAMLESYRPVFQDGNFEIYERAQP